MGEAARPRFPFLAPRRRERAVDLTLHREEKSAVGLQPRLTGQKMFPTPPFINAVDVCKKLCERIHNI